MSPTVYPTLPTCEILPKMPMVKEPSTQSKHLLLFGDLVERLYTAYGRRRAPGILYFLVKAELVAFHGRNRFLLTRVK